MAAIGIVALTVVGTVALARSRSPGCALPAPIPDLPDRLRAIGDFDQPYDAADEHNLEEVALRVGAALHRDLIGSTAVRSVPVAAALEGRHDAVVVPLIAAPAPGRPRTLAGLVAFLRDCTGRLYFSAVEDDTNGSAPATGFPRVTRDEAQSRLVYRESPFLPVWRDRGGGAEAPAQ